MLPVGTNVEVTRLPKATLSLIALNIAFFVLEVFTPPGTIGHVLDSLAYSPKNLNPLSLVTSLFLHGGFFHLFGNMLYLWIFGGPVEERIGPKLFLYYYFIAGLCSTALWGLLAAIANPDNPGSAIGASGAISGIMALFLYRCYYGKIRMTLPLVPTFFFVPWMRFSIPAAPLILYWFLRDLMGGFSSLSARTGIAYWGHVGGFLCGIAIGRIKRYGHEAQLEQTKARLLRKIEEGYGWKSGTAGRELLKLLELAPRDPEVHHQLAHYYSENGKTREAAEHYQQAAVLYAPTDPLAGAYVVIEHADVLKRPMAAHHHLKAAETLIGKGYIEDAERALAPAADAGVGVIGERLLFLLCKVRWALKNSDGAGAAAQQLRSRYPAGRHTAEIGKVLALRPENVFPRRPEAVSARQAAEQSPEKESIGENKFLYLVQVMNQVVTDPFFIFLWVFMLSWGGGVSLRGVVFTFVFSFIIVSYFRVDWAYHWSMFNRRSEEEARKEVSDTITYDRAVLAERGDNCEKAVMLYEKLLASEPKNLQARYNLAKLYHRKLNDLGNALPHFKKLLEQCPYNHPYHREAREVIKNPKRRQSDQA